MAWPHLLASLASWGGLAQPGLAMLPAGDVALPAGSAACLVARAALPDTGNVGTKYISADTPGVPTVLEGKGGLKPLERDSAFWRVGWTGKAPDPNLVERWYLNPLQSAAGCFPDFKRTDGNDGDRRRSPLRGNSGDYRITISYPVFDRGSQHALVLVEYYALAGIGGATELCLLERNDQAWKVVGRRVLIVS